MTLEELKAQARLLTKAQRDELVAYLRATEQAQSEAWRAKITERARRLERGEGVPIQSVDREGTAQRPA